MFPVFNPMAAVQTFEQLLADEKSVLPEELRDVETEEEALEGIRRYRDRCNPTERCANFCALWWQCHVALK